MATSLTLRSVKGSALTYVEMDANLTALRETADAALPADAAVDVTATKATELVSADRMLVRDSVDSTWKLVSPDNLPAAEAPVPADPVTLSLWDWWYQSRIGNANVAANDVFLGAPISSGTNTTAIPTTGLGGYNSNGVFLRSSTTANGGYRYQTSSLVSDYFGTLSHKMRFQFMWLGAFTGRTVRGGYLDTSTSSDSTDGAYFEIVGDVCSAKTANNSTRTTNATTVTLSLNTAYTFDVEVNAAGTSARFRVYSGTTETPILDVTNTANIPTTSARAFGAGVVATESSTTASDIGILYSLGIGTVEGFQVMNTSQAYGDIEALLADLL